MATTTTYRPEIIPTPVRAQLYGLLDAIALLRLAADDLDGAEDGVEEAEATLEHAIECLEIEVDGARLALAKADEPRRWVLRENGYDFRTIVATYDEAVAEAEGCNGGDYGDVTETVWTDIYAVCEETGEEESVTVEIEPDEPRCRRDSCTCSRGGASATCECREHDWQSPHEVLGGLKENPGAWGSGGGVEITRVCAHCGAYRVIDTWAQRPDTGEQGLTSVAYREADDESLAWVESLREDDEE